MSVVRGTSLSEYPQLVTELGGDPVALLRDAGINPADIGDYEVFLPFSAVVRVVEDAAALLAPTDFGRRLALRQGIEILGPVGVAARTAATVADAFRIFGTYLAAYSPALSLSISSLAAPGRSFFEFQIVVDGLRSHPHATELSMGVSLRVLRHLLGTEYRPISAHLPHEPLAAQRIYDEFFGCRTLFAQSATGFTLRSTDLARPLKQDVLAHEAVVRYLDTLIADESNMTQSVRAIVRHLLPTGTVSLELVAAQFQLHPKALQRRLTAEGTTFAAVTDVVRRTTAHRYLRDTDIALGHLSRELGYAEQSELSRSCRRWFGCGPTAYRKTLNSAPSAIEI
ncbi:MAG: AraC family transcriptional regulator [Mycobacterium sp.]|nr:AraC family transcriptional regulator [Mycobacterium sp.]